MDGAAEWRVLERALMLPPEEIFALLRDYGLRRKGGAPGLVADHWERCRGAGRAPGAAPGGRAEMSAAQSPVVVGTAIDGSDEFAQGQHTLREDSRRVLTGLLIAAHAVGAEHCYVCVEEGQDYSRLRDALGELAQDGDRRRQAWVGRLGGVQLKVMKRSLLLRDPGALLANLTHRQALPDVRYSDPALHGLDGRPTLVESAETLASVAAVLGMTFVDRNSVDASVAEGEKGLASSQEAQGRLLTVMVAGQPAQVVFLGGDCTIREAIETALGACVEVAEVQGIQLGGPFGPFLGGLQLENPLTVALVEEAGGSMGGAAMRVLLGKQCGVDLALEALRRLQLESCGKCPACYEGVRQLVGFLESVMAGVATSQEGELARVLSQHMLTASLCDVGKLAPAPFLSALVVFADHFGAHLEGTECPACVSRESA